MRGISDAQHSTIIGIVARIPVPDARKIFLTRLEAQLPAKGSISAERLTDAINCALRSFPAGAFCGDAQGAYPCDLSTLTLKECADLYQRMCRQVGAWTWPPKATPTPEELAAGKAKFDALPLEQKAEAYARLLYPSEEAYQRHKREEEARREAEETADTTPWPLGPSPPTTRTIRGEIEPDAHEEPEQPAPTDDDLRRVKRPDGDKLPDNHMHEGDWDIDENPPLRGGKRPASIYGEATAYAKRRGVGNKIKSFFS